MPLEVELPVDYEILSLTAYYAAVSMQDRVKLLSDRGLLVGQFL
jgi:hypothetical protein